MAAILKQAAGALSKRLQPLFPPPELKGLPELPLGLGPEVIGSKPEVKVEGVDHPWET